jgi:hypothetical protein
MTELDLLREFRADAPAPSDEATARARRSWERPPRRRGGLPRLALAGSLAAAAVAALLVLPSERATEVAGAAPTLLRSAAAAEAGGVTRPLRDGEYWYVKRLTAWPSIAPEEPHPFTVTQPAYREEWIAGDGSRGWRVRPFGEPRFPTARDRANWKIAGSPSPGAPEDHRASGGSFYLGAKEMSYDDLLDLPRDPHALFERLHDASVECECGNGVDQETFVIAGDLLRDTPLPVDLRAAILRATAYIPGIKLVSDVRDVSGRPGEGVAFNGVGGESVLVFDRETHALLGENEDGGGSADLESAIVGGPTEVP